MVRPLHSRQRGPVKGGSFLGSPPSRPCCWYSVIRRSVRTEPIGSRHVEGSRTDGSIVTRVRSETKGGRGFGTDKETEVTGHFCWECFIIAIVLGRLTQECNGYEYAGFSFRSSCSLIAVARRSLFPSGSSFCWKSSNGVPASVKTLAHFFCAPFAMIFSAPVRA